MKKILFCAVFSGLFLLGSAVNADDVYCPKHVICDDNMNCTLDSPDPTDFRIVAEGNPTPGTYHFAGSYERQDTISAHYYCDYLLNPIDPDGSSMEVMSNNPLTPDLSVNNRWLQNGGTGYPFQCFPEFTEEMWHYCPFNDTSK